MVPVIALLFKKTFDILKTRKIKEFCEFIVYDYTVYATFFNSSRVHKTSLPVVSPDSIL